MLPTQLNILFFRGDDWPLQVLFPLGISLIGWGVLGQVRDRFDGLVLATMTHTVDAGNPRALNLSISKLQTREIVPNISPEAIPEDWQTVTPKTLEAPYVWDLQLTTPDGFTRTYLYGSVLCVADVAHA